MTHTGPDVPFHPGPTYRPPSKPIRSNMPSSQESLQNWLSVENINPVINLDFEEFTISGRCDFLNFPRTGQIILSRPQKLKDLINMSNLIKKFLPKQADIDKILKAIQRKVLKETHLSVEIKKDQA